MKEKLLLQRYSCTAIPALFAHAICMIVFSFIMLCLPAFAYAGSNLVQPAVAVPEADRTSPEKWWKAGISTGWSNRYFLDGLDGLAYSKNKGFLWTDINFSARGFLLGAWYAEPTHDDYNELDLYFYYFGSYKKLDYRIGYFYYTSPLIEHSDGHSLSGMISTSAWSFATPSLTVIYDTFYNGLLLKGELLRTISLIPNRLDLELSAGASYGLRYHSTRNEPNNVEAGIAFPTILNSSTTLRVFVKHSWSLAAVRDYQEESIWFTGFSLTFTF